MAIRITTLHEGPTTVLQVDGWLRGVEAKELIGTVERSGSEVALDLAELRRADRPGIEALRSLAARGVPLRRVVPLIALQLEAGSTRESD